MILLCPLCFVYTFESIHVGSIHRDRVRFAEVAITHCDCGPILLPISSKCIPACRLTCVCVIHSFLASALYSNNNNNSHNIEYRCTLLTRTYFLSIWFFSPDGCIFLLRTRSTALVYMSCSIKLLFISSTCTLSIWCQIFLPKIKLLFFNFMLKK